MSKIMILLIFFTLLPACTRQPERPEVSRLHRDVEEAESSLTQFDEKLKSAPTENINSLQYDRELLRSRLERLKEQLRVLQNSPLPPSPTH